MEKELTGEVIPKPVCKKQKGVTIVEYVIMLALIAIAVATAGPTIKDAVLTVFTHASSVMMQSY